MSKTSKGKGSENCCYLKVKVCVITRSPEEASKLEEILKPDDVPVEGLSYRSFVEGNSLCYLFASDKVLTLRNAADEVLEHCTLVETSLKQLKGLEEPRGGKKIVREKEGRSEGQVED